MEQHVVTPLAQWLAAHASAPPAKVLLRVGAEGRVELG
ncbi:hypothetical protein ACLESD_48355 [Pyxidicoccus sp. 3LFB2]